MTQPNVDKDFFANQSTLTLTAAFQKINFERTMNTVQVRNDDGAVDLEISFNGDTLHDILVAGEALTYEDRRRSAIWVRSSSAIDYRVAAWLRA